MSQKNRVKKRAKKWYNFYNDFGAIISPPGPF